MKYDNYESISALLQKYPPRPRKPGHCQACGRRVKPEIRICGRCEAKMFCCANCRCADPALNQKCFNLKCACHTKKRLGEVSR